MTAREKILGLVKDETTCAIAIVPAGVVMVEAGGETHRLHPYDKPFPPTGLGPSIFPPAPPA